MPKAQKWNVEIEGQTYEIIYKPNVWSDKTNLTINGETTAIKSNGLQALAGIDTPITVGGKKLQFVRVGQKADIAMDGIYLDSKKEYKPIGKVPWWGWIFAVLGIVIPVVSLGGALPVLLGIAAAVSCIRISVQPQMKTAVKAFICFGITVLAWILFLLLILGVSAF